MSERKGVHIVYHILQQMLTAIHSLEQILSSGFRSRSHSPEEAAQELAAGGSSYGSFFYVRTYV